MAWSLATAVRNAACDATVDRIDGGTPGLLRIYGGTRPANPDATAGAATLLAEVTLANPAFGNAGAVNPGQADLVDPGAVTGLANGTATWCRFVTGGTAAGGAGVLDGDVGTSGKEVNLNTTTISTGVAFDITGGSITHP